MNNEESYPIHVVVPYLLSGIGIRVEKDAQTFESVPVTKDRAWFGSLFGQEDTKSITNQACTLAIDSELKLDLKVGRCQWLCITGMAKYKKCQGYS